MSETNIRLAACAALAAIFDANISVLTGKVQALAADLEDITVFPSLRVLPGKFSFTRWQEQENDDSVTGKALIEVGTFEGTVELRLSAKSEFEREQIGALVMQQLLAREDTAGVTVVQTPPVLVGGQQWLAPALCSFCLTDEDWREEMVFSDKRYDYITLDAYYPALVARTGIGTMDTFLFELATNDDALETEQIADDGTLTKV